MTPERDPYALQPRLLLVDDEPSNLRVLRQVLMQDYRLTFAKSGEEALALVRRELPDLVLMDVMMPGMTGLEVCRKLKLDEATRKVPIIFVTALKDETDETSGFEAGAVDYITKPISPAVVKARVRTHLTLVRADELKQTRQQIIRHLGRASEYKDNETGMHIIRMSQYSRLLALASGFSAAYADELQEAAPMHDIGKIGIPDYIMLKTNKLSEEEFAIMKRHPLIGAEILGEGNSTLMKLAYNVALYHHEKWDGSGYPHGLAGEAIPIEARIVAVADVFDALTSKRPYKEAWPFERALAHIKAASGTHFDPALVHLLELELPRFLEIRTRWEES
jgi:putative two-component system response regulator